MADPREGPGGPAHPAPSQDVDPALDRSMNGGGAGGSYWKFTVVDS